MAMFSSKRNNSNNFHTTQSSNSQRSPKSAPQPAPILASCYAASSSSTVVQGFHYSSTGTNGGHSGVPEAPSGYPKSPPSKSSAESKRARSPTASSTKGASRTIAKECERLLCGDMKRIFLGGRPDSTEFSRPMGSIYGGVSSGIKKKQIYDYDDSCGSDYSSSEGSSNNSNSHPFGGEDRVKREMKFIEVWDYVGGTSFRGFIAEKETPRGKMEETLFLFFKHVAGTQLKHGLMALIELATECFECDRLVICLERNAEGLHGLVRDLGWVGFELITLAHWMQTEIPRSGRLPSARCGSFSSVSTSSSVFSDDDITSEKWLFMGMEL